MLGVYTILETANYGWGSTRTLGLGALALALLVAFIVRESRIPNPLVPLSIFRSRAIAGANAVQMLTVAGIFGMFFLGVLYLQRVLGYDALETGLAFLPVSTLIGILSLGFSARLSQRYGATAVLVPGLALIAVGLVGVRASAGRRQLPGRRPAGDDPARDRRRPLLPLAHHSGGVRGVAERVGPGVRAPQHEPAGGRGDRAGGAGDPGRHPQRRTSPPTVTSTASALTSGYHLAFLIGAGLVVAAIVVALAVLGRIPARAAEQEEEEVPVEELAYAEAA